MNNAEHARKVRDWIMTFPGHIDAPSSQKAIRKTWAASGVEGSVGDFATAFYSAGYKPNPVRDFFRLKLPAPPVQSFPARRKV